MVREKDILYDLCKAESCSVPEGYFKQLQDRLVSIPESQRVAHKPRASAYLALVGGIAAVAIGGFVILKVTTEQQVSDNDYMYEQMLYADALPLTYSLYDAYEQAAASSEVSLEEYINDINE